MRNLLALLLSLFFIVPTMTGRPALAVEQCPRVAELTGENSTHSAEQLVEKLSPGWTLARPGSAAYERYVKDLPEAMRLELTDVGRWSATQTATPRLPVPVARLTRDEIEAMSKPRAHEPLPSFDRGGALVYPEHVQLAAGEKAQPSENFYVRMMAVKDRGSLELILPKAVEYLRPFIEKAWQIEMARDPKGFKDRYAFIQVDASWVEKDKNQPRPGRTTQQSAVAHDRKGAHVDGFLQKPFWGMEEDITYATSFGYSAERADHHGDSIPTEFFTVGFPIPAGLTHPEARIIFDRIANENPDSVMTLPPGLISRMSSRVVHRVGVAKELTYRTFIKIKFTDEAFNQAENTVNVQDDGKPQAFYARWARDGIPLVSRQTLPTEGVIQPEDVASVKPGTSLAHARR